MFEPGYTYNSNKGPVKIYDKAKVRIEYGSGSIDDIAIEERLLGALIHDDGTSSPITLTLNGHNVTHSLHLENPDWLATEAQRHWVINRLGGFAATLPSLDTRQWPTRARDLFNQTKKVFS